MSIYRKIRIKQQAEADWKKIQEIAEGGTSAALAYFKEEGRGGATDYQCESLFRSCAYFADRYSSPWWKEGRLFCVVAMDWTGPGVEVVR